MFNEGNCSIMVLDNLDVPYTNNNAFLRATFSRNAHKVGRWFQLSVLSSKLHISYANTTSQQKSLERYALNEKGGRII